MCVFAGLADTHLHDRNMRILGELALTAPFGGLRCSVGFICHFVLLMWLNRNRVFIERFHDAPYTDSAGFELLDRAAGQAIIDGRHERATELDVCVPFNNIPTAANA